MLNGNLFELDLSQLRRTVQSLKDNVLKAEDKVIRSIYICLQKWYISTLIYWNLKISLHFLVRLKQSLC